MKSPSRTRLGSKPQSIGLLSEADIQSQVVEYVSLLAARCGFLFCSIPNEGKDRANPARLAKLKRMGLRPGAGDLLFIKRGLSYFLEMKKPGEKQSDDQIDFQLDCAMVGAQYAVAWSFEEAVEILQLWGIISP